MRFLHSIIPVCCSTLGPVLTAQDPSEIQAPHVVIISEKLVTSGQPTRDALQQLAKGGFQAVIYLAPPTVTDAIAEEPQLVVQQGLSYVNIPVAWGHPTEANFQAFVKAMRSFEGKKVLVHCQANMRASTFTFLYRVIACRENPAQAYEAVRKVWVPKDQWRDFVNLQLQGAKIPFEVR